MSVLKRKRGESKSEFIYNARQLEIFTIRQCVNFPKRYTFYVSQPIVDMTNQIYNNVKRANSVYPINRQEVQLRRDYFMMANTTLYALVSQIEIANELFSIKPNVLQEWMGYVDKEMKLIKAVMKSDKERFKF